MRAAAPSRPGRRARMVALALLLAAAAVAALLALQRRATIDDARIEADVVHIAPQVAGRIVALAVRDDDAVRRGQLLLRIDPTPYALQLRQARAQLEAARAALARAQRSIEGERDNARIAAAQITRARHNLGLSARTRARLAPLAAQGYVARQQLDQAVVAERDARTSLRQALAQSRAAQHAVGDVAAARAEVDAASAAVALAQYRLAATAVRAPHAGRIVGLRVASGETVAPGQSVFTLVDTRRWYAVADVRETDLRAVGVGECATVYAMLDRGRALRGVVEGIGWGVLDPDTITLPRALPYVRASLNWVRVAQRFPVRVRLLDPPAGLLRLGASASVELRHGTRCR